MNTKVLVRNDNYQTLYQQWKKLNKQLVTDAFKTMYEKYLLGENESFLTINKDNKQAQLIFEGVDFTINDFSFLIDFFKETVLEQNYYLYMSDERILNETEFQILNIHRHYLKPNVDYLESLVPNAHLLYGNIVIEHHFNKNKNNMMITANYYSQKQYFSFEKLMEYFLK